MKPFRLLVVCSTLFGVACGADAPLEEPGAQAPLPEEVAEPTATVRPGDSEPAPENTVVAMGTTSRLVTLRSGMPVLHYFPTATRPSHVFDFQGTRWAGRMEVLQEGRSYTLKALTDVTFRSAAGTLMATIPAGRTSRVATPTLGTDYVRARPNYLAISRLPLSMSSAPRGTLTTYSGMPATLGVTLTLGDTPGTITTTANGETHSLTMANPSASCTWNSFQLVAGTVAIAAGVVEMAGGLAASPIGWPVVIAGAATITGGMAMVADSQQCELPTPSSAVAGTHRWCINMGVKTESCTQSVGYPWSGGTSTKTEVVDLGSWTSMPYLTRHGYGYFCSPGGFNCDGLNRLRVSAWSEGACRVSGDSSDAFPYSTSNYSATFRSLKDATREVTRGPGFDVKDSTTGAPCCYATGRTTSFRYIASAPYLCD